MNGRSHSVSGDFGLDSNSTALSPKNDAGFSRKTVCAHQGERVKFPPIQAQGETTSHFESPLPQLSTEVEQQSLVIEIGEISVRVNRDDRACLGMLRNRYSGLVGNSRDPEIEFDVELAPPSCPIRMPTSRWSIARASQ